MIPNVRWGQRIWMMMKRVSRPCASQKDMCVHGTARVEKREELGVEIGGDTEWCLLVPSVASEPMVLGGAA